jgi:hypothetical protein
MIDKETENVAYFKYLGSIITNDARCTRETKSRISMAKAAFDKERALFTGKLNFKGETSTMLHLQYSSV